MTVWQFPVMAIPPQTSRVLLLLADANLEKLPFDVSGFRTLFYENSIVGKRKFEEGLRKHIAAIFQIPLIPAAPRP
jgi:hypothetical protein